MQYKKGRAGLASFRRSGNHPCPYYGRDFLNASDPRQVSVLRTEGVLKLENKVMSTLPINE